mmetsp:Transcript_17151/g.53818  ORF Transcript_17151/g.53818 Transcript_17151/m.53818 type:complete len:448 (+) Transcript_17151:148-1491(+)
MHGRQLQQARRYGHHGEGPTDDGKDLREEVIPPSIALGHHHLHWREVVGELRLGDGVSLQRPHTPLVRLLVAPETGALEAGVDHLDEVVGCLVELVHCEGPAVQGVDLAPVLRWQRVHGAPWRLPKGEVVHGMGYVGEGQVQRPVAGVHRLEVHGARDAGHLHMSADPAALPEDLVVRSARVHVPLRNLAVHEGGQGLWAAHPRVLRPLLLLRAPSVEPDGGEAYHALLLAGLLKVHAVDLQHSHARGHAVRILGDVLLVVHLVFERLPRGRELPAVRAPVSVEVHQRKVVRIDYCLETVMLEVVAGGTPVCIQLREFLLGEALVGKLQLHELVLGVGVPCARALVIDALLRDVTGDVHALSAKGIPHTHGHKVACHIEHVNVEVDAQRFILIAVDHDARRRLRRHEGRELAEKQQRANDDRQDSHHGAGDGGLCQVLGYRAEGIEA